MTMPETSDLLRALKSATENLLFPSESDFPIESYMFGPREPSPESLTHALGLPAGTHVEATTTRSVFEGLIETPDDPSAARFSGLLTLLERELSDLSAYRLGDVDIDIVILGRDPSGEWLGIKTKAVET